MTGLSKLTITSTLHKNWTDTNQRLFCTAVTSLVHIVNQCTFRFKLSQTTLQEYLPIIASNVFQRRPESSLEDATHRCLRLNLVNKGRYVKVTTTQGKRYVDIYLEHQGDMKSFAKKVFKENVPLHDVDEFILNIDDSFRHEAKMEMYDTFFEALPSLKKMKLDLPEDFEETKQSFFFSLNSTWLRALEELTLRPQMEAEFQTLLDELGKRLPNLKRLNFYSVPGVWRRHIEEYQVRFKYLKLETLVIDVHDLISKAAVQDDMHDFFVVEMEFAGNSEKRQLYKVDVEELTMSEIEDADLKGLIRGDDYYRLHIMLMELQCLILVDLQGHKADSIDIKNFDHVKLYFDDE